MNHRLGSIKPKEFIHRLQKAGFWIDHQRGSHIVMMNNEKRRIVVPYHIREMKRGLLFGLIKQAGLTIEEFQKLK
ncbi:MAG: type II toxin-antitoxin system HicA family toxin [Elusimicrobiota bacterium]